MTIYRNNQLKRVSYRLITPLIVAKVKYKHNHLLIRKIKIPKINLIFQFTVKNQY